jgi:hypothetical protein
MATIVGRQDGGIVFSTTFVVTDAVGGDATKYFVRVRDGSRFGPGVVTWTAFLTVAGDSDGPAGDVAFATTRLATEDGDQHDRHDLHEENDRRL